MAIALFDLDNTLLHGDSDHLWGQYLCDSGVVDSEEYGRENDRFFAEYEAGTLDIQEYNEFCLKPLTEHSLEQLHSWRDSYIEELIRPVILDAGVECIASHHDAGDQVIIITATNQFITAPIATLLGVDGLIATVPETLNGKYTGKIHGTPCFQDGKILRFQEWQNQTNQSFTESYFYSDSSNDIPLLEYVNHPIAVDPDQRLLEHAGNNQWPVMSFRGATFND